VSGSCSCVDWSGGGDPATANDTCTFITHWDSPGVKTVTATPDCGDSKQKQVTVVASGSLVLKDVHTGNSEVDESNDDPQPEETVYAGTDTDGKGDVEFWIVDPDIGESYSWEITPGGGDGTLSGTTEEDYKGEDNDLEAGKEYTITVTHGGDPDYIREIEFVIPKVEITDDAGEPITGTQTVSVGEEISLDTAIEPAGLTGSDWQWTVPGERVKDYGTTDRPEGNGRTRAQVTKLDEDDLDSSAVAFYWVDGEDGREVSVTCTVEGITCEDSVEFNVKRPSASVQEIDDGEVDVTGSKLHYGTEGAPGFEWTMIAYGNGFAGDIKFTQVMNADVQRTATDDTTESCKVPAWWLDLADPYKGKQKSLTAIGSEVLAMYDWPYIPLPTDYKKMNNKFMKFKETVA